MQETFTPLRHGVRASRRRVVVARQQEFELRLALHELPPGTCEQRIEHGLALGTQGIVRIRVRQDEVQPTVCASRTTYRQSTAKQAVRLPGIPAGAAAPQRSLEFAV